MCRCIIAYGISLASFKLSDRLYMTYKSKLFFRNVHFLRTLFIRPANGSLNPGAAGLVVVLAGLVDPVGVDVGGPPPPVGPTGLAAAEAAAAASSGRNIYSQC